MELMLLVYLVENLSYGGTFFKGIFVISLMIIAIYIFTKSLFDEEFNLSKFPTKRVLTFLTIILTLHTILPVRQTMIYMVGAYTAQEVLTSDKTKELGGKTYKALSNQLDKWAEEVPELKEIVTENVVSVVKDKVSEELTK